MADPSQWVQDYVPSVQEWRDAFGSRLTAVGDTSLTMVRTPNSTTERSLADRFSNVFNIMDFGGVADGVHDDAPAWNETIEAALANGGGRIIVDCGAWRFGSTVIVPNTPGGVAKLRFEGHGFASSVSALVALDSLIEIRGPETTFVGIAFENNGNFAQTAIKHNAPVLVNGVYTSAGAYVSEISHCFFTVFPMAIVNQNGNNLVIDRNFFNTCSNCFVCLDWGMGTTLTRNTMLGGNGIDFRAPISTEAEGVQIALNNIYPGVGFSFCIRLQAGLEFQIGLNVLAETHGPASTILLDASALHPIASIKIINNWLGTNSDDTATGSNGVVINFNTHDVVVSDNTFAVMTGYGVLINGSPPNNPAQDIVIANNRFFLVALADISVNDALHVRIYGNNCQGAAHSIIRSGTTIIQAAMNNFRAVPQVGPADTHFMNDGQRQLDAINGTPIGLQVRAAGAFAGLDVLNVSTFRDNINAYGSVTVSFGVQAGSISSLGTLNAVGNLTVGGTTSLTGGFGINGAAPITRQPSPTTLAGVIAMLQSYGFCS